MANQTVNLRCPVVIFALAVEGFVDILAACCGGGRGMCEREFSLCLGTSFSFHTTEKCLVLAHSTNMRGGRGGGRGRGRSAPSAGQDLIRETQMDLGIDKFGPDQNEAPVLYPRMDLPGPVRILEEDVAHVAKQRELAADMAKSIYYITPKYAVKDVERYSDVLHGAFQGQALAGHLSAGMKRYLPPELTDRPTIGTSAAAGAIPGLKALPAFDGKSLTALEDKERKSAETGAEKEKEKEKEDAGMLSDIEAEVEEEEQDDDYAVDHYESGDESAGDDEPAAVF